MRKLFYMGLEPYESRYTLQLTGWSRRAFARRAVDFVEVPGTTIDNSKSIQVGQVLDAHGRSYFAMSQMMNLVQMMRNGEVKGDDAIFFEDMFQPGMESLPYIMNQIPQEQRPAVWIRCLAQAIDPDDFVHVWGMSKWMSLYEEMCNEFVTGVLASNEEMVAHMKIANWKAPIYNISGLAFDAEEVQSRITQRTSFVDRTKRVVFAARFDQEKQPNFFMDLVENLYDYESNYIATDTMDDHNLHHPSYVRTRFAILQGGPLRSNNDAYVERARLLEQEGKLEIHENLSKNEYYEILNDSRVLFNCALQDWTSNTVSEADALGCNVLYPAYRSFPEIFNHDHNRLYIPWSLEDARKKLVRLINGKSLKTGEISAWTSKTVDRCIDIMNGDGEEWRRDNNRYRDYVATKKY
jgi:hypothetical protein